MKPKVIHDKIDISLVLPNEGQINDVPQNPRRIDEKKFKKLCKSIKALPELTEAREIIVYPLNGNYIALGGNMRLNAYRELNWKKVPVCILPEDMPMNKLREIVIQDNNSFGETDWDMIANEWDVEELEDWGFDVWEKPGTKKKEIKDDDYTPQNEIKTDIKYGDLFEITDGGITHRLQCGDSCKEDDVKNLLNGNLADMVFTDPPYELEDSFSDNIFNIAKDDCHIFIMDSDKILLNIANRHIKSFRKFFVVDFRIARLVSNNQPMTRCDLIAEFVNGKTKFNNLKDGFSTLIECAKIHSNKIDSNFGHKQAKRVELPSTFIQHYSKKGELIVDLFAGSGSTLMAAHQLKRVCYTQEYDPSNCQIILDRFKKSFPESKINMI